MSNIPTYYGSVAIKTQAGTTDLDNQTQGALDCCVQQPTRFSYGRDGAAHLEEQFKCPISKVTKLDPNAESTAYKVYDSVFQPGYVHPEIQNDTNFVCRFLPPQPPIDTSWVVESVSVQELTPGDHCLLTVTSKAEFWNTSDTELGSDLVEGDTWNLEWREIDMSVLTYCKNAGGSPHWERFIPNANDDILKPDASKEVQTAEATYIKECAQSSNYNARWGQLGAYEWVRNLSVYSLNDKEKQIFQYYINNINPRMHVPVLTHTITSKYSKYGEKWRDLFGRIKHIPYKHDTDGTHVGNIIDTVLKSSQLTDGMPNGCPYDTWYTDKNGNEQRYEWLCTGDRMQEVNNENATVYVRTIEFTGAKAWCAHFYRNASWTIDDSTPTKPWQIGEE